VIDPTNTDAILIITLRKKNPGELLLYPFVTYRTEDMFEAVLITSLDKGKKVLLSDFSPWDTPIPALTKLLKQTCKILGEKMSENTE
jgi:hypothetical protein